jgi:hypothetical protein
MERKNVAKDVSLPEAEALVGVRASALENGRSGGD